VAPKDALGNIIGRRTFRHEMTVRVYMQAYSSVRDAVGALAHEADHAVKLGEFRSFLGKTGEFEAYSRELLYKYGRMPNAVERAEIWRHVFEKYPGLSMR